MSTQDTGCSIAPYFKIPEGKLDEFICKVLLLGIEVSALEPIRKRISRLAA